MTHEGAVSSVSGEDYAAQQREAGANVVSASHPGKEGANVGETYRSIERVYSDPNKQGTRQILFKVGDPIPEDEARRQGLIKEATEPEPAPEVQTEVQPEVQVEKPPAPKGTTRKTAAKRPPSTKE